jgi:hypothetical protein
MGEGTRLELTGTRRRVRRRPERWVPGGGFRQWVPASRRAGTHCATALTAASPGGHDLDLDAEFDRLLDRGLDGLIPSGCPTPP